MNIIKFDKKYANKVIEFIKSIAMNEYNRYDWEDYFNRMDFKEYEIDDNIFYIVLNEKNEIVGTIGGLKKEKGILYMNSLYIRKDYRKIGIATKLYSLLIIFCKEKRYKEITLRVFFNFTDAIHFYEKNGFEKYSQDEESYYYKKVLE